MGNKKITDLAREVRKKSVLRRYAKGMKLSEADLMLAGILEKDGSKTNPRIKFPVIEGIEAAAKQIGCPVTLVKTAKRDGCKAFLTGNRVDTGILIPFLFSMLAKGSKLPEGISTPQDWLATEKAKREEIRRKKDEKEVMSVVEVTRQANEAGALFMNGLEKLARELPPSLAGLPSSGVAARMESEIENIRRNLKIKLAEITE